MSLRTSLRIAGLGVLLALGTTSAFAQQEVTKVEISGGLSFVRANTADGQCACFSLVGGSSSLVMNSSERLSAVADVSYVHSANINSSERPGAKGADGCVVVRIQVGNEVCPFRNPSRRFEAEAQV